MSIFKNLCKKNLDDSNIDANNERKDLMYAFSASLFIGILLILSSIIINNLFDNIALNAKLLFWLEITVEFLKNIGVALVIAFIFSFVSSTEIFIEFVRKRLITIINSKDYLKKLSQKEQRTMLENIMKSEKEPSYKEINSYIDKHINQSLSIYKELFRSSYQVNAIAKIVQNVVIVECILRYRMYSVDGKYEDLNIGLEDQNVNEVSIEVISPNGEKRKLEAKVINKEHMHDQKIKSEFLNDPSIINELIAELPQEYNQYEYIDVINRLTEHGNDHWHLYTLRVLKPCNNFSLFLSCEDGLIIKKYIPYGELNSININRQDIKKIDIFCNEWMEPGLGIAILIAKSK